MEVGPASGFRYWEVWVIGIAECGMERIRVSASKSVEMKCAPDAGAVGAARREGECSLHGACGGHMGSHFDMEPKKRRTIRPGMPGEMGVVVKEVKGQSGCERARDG